MQNPDHRITRRTALKGAAASSVGVVVGGALAEQVAKQTPSWDRTKSGSRNGRGA